MLFAIRCRQHDYQPDSGMAGKLNAFPATEQRKRAVVA
ncbi:Uncharacterised protein [Raoultella terrigena]|uniref:Uncharacterized protein n=1 Tax=Raoultella terrigena TaxID=577 RepID=A0A3P8KNZ4_RAOTE|nr:Uncharacterised protein [Raoultella terrigena]